MFVGLSFERPYLIRGLNLMIPTLLENCGFWAKNCRFLMKTAVFGPKTTDLGLNTCENTCSFTFESGANGYTLMFYFLIILV